jgi:hypothetical protein
MDKSEATTMAGQPSAHVPRERSQKGRLTRWHASGLHLLISAGIAAAVLTLMLLVWYPPPLFEAAGGNELALILIGVDVVIGPLLTLIIFKPGKWGLKFDLVAIALFQIAALAYGSYIIYLARPAFVVFVKDRFEVVSAVELKPDRLADARFEQFRKPPLTGPMLVGGAWPTAQAEQQMLLDANLAGEDLHHFPKYYVPYADSRQEILAKADPLARVREIEPSAARIIDEWLAGSGHTEQDVLHLRLRARHAWVAVLIDRRTAQPVKMLVTERL